ncbi:unnamed protein product [Phytomonas sp. EM1]|nr:unnamed protein product [Phytomonas sp. EM1]|eukprot:CCW60488.1 unnamed protein product [Phytomonas sp. isolate EM1]
MIRVVSSVGKAAYKAASKTGLTAGKEQPPYPCALPLQVVNGPDDMENIRRIADAIFEAALDLFHNPEHDWKTVEFRDPDGGDLVLMTKSHIGQFNFARATMSFMNSTPELFLSTVHGESFEMRKEFSSELVTFNVLANPTPMMNIQYHEYRAPPPISNRYLIYLVEKRYVAEEDTWYIYGCSINYPPFKKFSSNAVCSICLWTWELSQVGNNTIATYASCLSPNGWVPTFIVNWMKGAIAKEMVAIRRFLYRQRPEYIPVMLSSPKLVEGNDECFSDDVSCDREVNHRISRENYIQKPKKLLNHEDDEVEIRFRDLPLQEEVFLWRDLEENEELQFF